MCKFKLRYPCLTLASPQQSVPIAQWWKCKLVVHRVTGSNLGPPTGLCMNLPLVAGKALQVPRSKQEHTSLTTFSFILVSLPAMSWLYPVSKVPIMKALAKRSIRSVPVGWTFTPVPIAQWWKCKLVVHRVTGSNLGPPTGLCMNLPLVAGKALQVPRSNRSIPPWPPSPLY